MVPVIKLRPLNSEADILSQAIPWQFDGGRSSTVQVFSATLSASHFQCHSIYVLPPTLPKFMIESVFNRTLVV